MNRTDEYDRWLGRIEGVRLLRDTDTQIPFVRLLVNTFDTSSARPISFHMPKRKAAKPGYPTHDEREVIGQLCERFGVASIFDLKGTWATMLCPPEEGRIVGIKPVARNVEPVMVRSRQEALRLTRIQAN